MLIRFVSVFFHMKVGVLVLWEWQCYFCGAANDLEIGLVSLGHKLLSP